ncbi:glycosyltransferase [bacterium]|nr:glycosyltransferase [bacterium]
MRIAMVSGSAGDTRCGVGDYAFELAQHLSLDAEVHLYFDREHGPLRPPYEKLSTLLLQPVAGYSVLHLPGVVRQLREGQYDIVHVQYPSRGFGNSPAPGFIPQSLAGMNSRSRVVATLHEWSSSHPLRVMVMDQMLPSLDLLIVTNEQELEKLAGKMRERTVMAIPVGNVLSSRGELEAIWAEAEGATPAAAPLAGPGGRKPLSLFHYGLPTTKGRGLRRLLEALKVMREARLNPRLYLGGDFRNGMRETEELLGWITQFELQDCVERLGHIPLDKLAASAESCLLGVFPFDEGYSSKRSSVATLSQLELPLVVGAGGSEEHPYYVPKNQSSEALALLLIELLRGRAEQEWEAQIEKQRDYGRRFSFSNIAATHLAQYEKLLKKDMPEDWNYNQ